MRLSDHRFHVIADQMFNHIFDELEEYDACDVDLLSGILTIDIEDAGQFLINKHEPLQQIWISSPVSGAAHYALDDQGKWLCTKTNQEILAQLSSEISGLIDEAVHI